MNLLRFAALGLTFVLSSPIAEAAPSPDGIAPLQTRYARIQVDARGFIVSIQDLKSGKEYSPAGHPSPLLSLHEDGQPNETLVSPASAVFRPDQKEIELKYPNGAVAVVKAEAKDGYFRFQLASLAPRGKVDNLVWGPLHTTISGKIGDIIGVVRDADFAIGLYGLDDNTIAGPVTDGDCYGMGYYIHSPDPKKYPLPANLKEGQWFNIGGDGQNDHAFYAHPEEYYQQFFGNGARLEPEFGSTVAYHARDRRKSYVHFFSLLPGMARYRPRHMVSDPLPGVDFLGSAVALYACPDDEGLATLEKITVAEHLPYITNQEGKWIRRPDAMTPTVHWSGPYDKAIEYTEALGFKALSRETGEFYPSLKNTSTHGGVTFADKRVVAGKEYQQLAHQKGLTYGGLHTLTVFLQGGVSSDVTPVPSEHLQTVCRTKLAKDISPTDTEIVVTDPSFLAEKGVWSWGDESNYLRIGGETLRYDGISDGPPWTLKGVKRGHASKAQAHQTGDEVAKLMQNCFNGFVPDMSLLMDYADWYAGYMTRSGMDTIGFDGFESTVYQHHGYYGVRAFCRRLFESYAKLNGGKFPYMTLPSNIFTGSWEYMASCNVGGGGAMFDAVSGRRGTQGKDIGTGFDNSYFPATFGIQGWHTGWSLYDAENLEAKSLGWNASYALNLSQATAEQTGEKDAIFKAFHAWEAARHAGVFSKETRERLRDPNFKYHLEQTGDKTFRLFPIQELSATEKAVLGTTELKTVNPYEDQPLHFALRIESGSGPIEGCTVTLPGGSQLKPDRPIENGQQIVCKGDRAYVADKDWKKIADLPLREPVRLPKGETKFSVELTGKAPANARFHLKAWAAGPGEAVGR